MTIAFTNRHSQRLRRRNAHRGVVLIVIIVTLSISLVLFGLWARNMVKEHQRFAMEQYRMQATRLAEAGLDRAIAQFAANPQFQEETWRVPAELLDGTHDATVDIRVMPGTASNMLRYEATAKFPSTATRRVQITKRIEAPAGPPESES